MPPSTAASSAMMDPLHAPHSAHARHPLMRGLSGATRSSAATVRLNQGEIHTVRGVRVLVGVGGGGARLPLRHGLVCSGESMGVLWLLSLLRHGGG